MRRFLILTVAVFAVSFAAEARAQGYGGLMGPSRVGTPRFVQGIINRGMRRPAPRNYWSQSLYSPGATFTTGRGPFGSFNQSTLYGRGYSYTSGYGVPSYGPGYGGYGYGGFAPYGGFGYGGFRGGFGGGY